MNEKATLPSGEALKAFSAAKVPENLDAVVIGSGIGGLAAAVLLSKAGKRVLVLEQHGKAGGCCHTFSKKGFEFDVGIHYIGQLGERSLMRFLVDQLTEGQLQWSKMPSVFDAVVLGEPGNGKTYRLYSGNKEYVEGLKKQFPDEAVAIEKFVRLVKRVAQGTTHMVILKMVPVPLVKFLSRTGLLAWFSPFFKMTSRSLTDVVNELTTNEELRAVFSYIFPTYGVLPASTSFSLHAILVDHYMEGAWYPRGGPSEIAFHTIPVIKQAGGAVLTKAAVQSILVNADGKACGVSVQKGQDLVNIFAPIVISDAGIFNTYERLLPAEIRTLPDIQAQLHMVDHGISGLSVFIGLNGSKEELGLEGTNYFIYSHQNLDEAMNCFFTASREEAAENIPILFVTSPSSKDPTWQERYPGKSTLCILALAQYEWFEEWKEETVQKRGAEYESLKNAMVESILKTVLKLYPHLEDKIECISSGSPLTNQHYIASPKGELYGAAHSISRLQAEATAILRSQTCVPNLYLTGQDICLCGFMGALQGAVLCASAVLQRNLYSDMLRLWRNSPANNSKKKD
ncbi:all-trans-retinol 13,14-reductase isoform X2 [Chelonoidis abingdonii]|uniref:all-trans-retinol 13,14-reductase isoform X2 n=1 Tax=Chelonoidis abingdonii TaxID=106734 RepID=UPI0013F2538D|nr:all-trans-retinol 13,14-reductase isoform X2 [Chelonoidis abingdonii]